MTQGHIQSEFAAGRITAEEAADLSEETRRPWLGPWAGVVLMAAVVAGSYGLLLLAGSLR